MAKKEKPLLNYLVYLAIRIVVAALQAIPLEAGKSLARGLAWLIYKVDKRHRQVAHENLALAFPELAEDFPARDRIVRKVLEHFCTLLIEIVHLPRIMNSRNWRKFLDLGDSPIIVDALLKNRPLMIVTGHFGNWEMAGFSLGLLGFTTHAIARTLDNPHLENFLRSFRERTGQKLLAKKGDFDQMTHILAAGGTDSNENNIPDWTEIRINDTNGLDTPGTIHSKTSPAVIEGKAKHLGLVTTNAPTPIAAPNGRFFTEVPLTSGTTTALNFAFENNALTQTADVHWLPTNLKIETSIIIREGDSLLLTAFTDAENASLENYSYTLNGSTTSNTADAPSAQAFPTAGTQTLTVTHTGADAITTTRTIQITVLPKVVIPTAPVCITGFTRTWTHPALPSGAILSIDNNIQASATGTANTLNLTTQTPINYPIIIKSPTGLILGSGVVKSTSVRGGDLTGSTIIIHTDTMQTVKMAIVTYGDLAEAEIRCDIIIGGVTYTDGTTTKNLVQENFDPYGVSEVLFRKPPSAHSNCHKYTILQNGVTVAKFN